MVRASEQGVRSRSSRHSEIGEGGGGRNRLLCHFCPPAPRLDIAVWLKDEVRVAALLLADGWMHMPEPGEDGYTGYRRAAVKLEVAFLARSETGEVYTPLRGGGRGEWPTGAFGSDVTELEGIRAKVVSCSALRADKAAKRDDPLVAAKDHADSQTLSRIDSR